MKKKIKRIVLCIGIALVIMYFTCLSMQIAYGAEERVWFSFMMDGTTCIEVKALDFEHAVCVLEILAEEDKYRSAEAINGCPGILAEDYYYDFSFKECF